MSDFVRYALYHVPDTSQPWAEWATRWLGWDAVSGRVPEPLAPEPRDAVTVTPRFYGLHATLKPPFRLSPGSTQAALSDAVAALARRLRPLQVDGLELAQLGQFLALRARGDETALNLLAAACVSELDTFGAPLSDAELARRRGKGLKPQQEANLVRWGYPHVMDTFRFHITLTSRLDRVTFAEIQDRLSEELVPILPAPYLIGHIALTGEARDGRFRLISRHRLTGSQDWVAPNFRAPGEASI